MPKSTKSETTRPARRRKAPTPAAAPVGGKIAALIALLRRRDGATIDAMMGVTGWQAHSVRGAISGAIKKGRGLSVLSEKTDAGPIYRIVDEAKA